MILAHYIELFRYSISVISTTCTIGKPKNPKVNHQDESLVQYDGSTSPVHFWSYCIGYMACEMTPMIQSMNLGEGKASICNLIKGRQY